MKHCEDVKKACAPQLELLRRKRAERGIVSRWILTYELFLSEGIGDVLRYVQEHGFIRRRVTNVFKP